MEMNAGYVSDTHIDCCRTSDSLTVREMQCHKKLELPLRAPPVRLPVGYGAKCPQHCSGLLGTVYAVLWNAAPKTVLEERRRYLTYRDSITILIQSSVVNFRMAPHGMVG